LFSELEQGAHLPSSEPFQKVEQCLAALASTQEAAPG
jgi:hypothetical protein